MINVLCIFTFMGLTITRQHLIVTNFYYSYVGTWLCPLVFRTQQYWQYYGNIVLIRWHHYYHSVLDFTLFNSRIICYCIRISMIFNLLKEQRHCCKPFTPPVGDWTTPCGAVCVPSGCSLLVMVRSLRSLSASGSGGNRTSRYYNQHLEYWFQLLDSRFTIGHCQ